MTGGKLALDSKTRWMADGVVAAYCTLRTFVVKYCALSQSHPPRDPVPKPGDFVYPASGSIQPISSRIIQGCPSVLRKLSNRARPSYYPTRAYCTVQRSSALGFSSLRACLSFPSPPPCRLPFNSPRLGGGQYKRLRPAALVPPTRSSPTTLAVWNPLDGHLLSIDSLYA
jgi:hypothetical protein